MTVLWREPPRISQIPYRPASRITLRALPKSQVLQPSCIHGVRKTGSEDKRICLKLVCMAQPRTWPSSLLRMTGFWESKRVWTCRRIITLKLMCSPLLREITQEVSQKTKVREEKLDMPDKRSGKNWFGKFSGCCCCCCNCLVEGINSPTPYNYCT